LAFVCKIKEVSNNEKRKKKSEKKNLQKLEALVGDLKGGLLITFTEEKR